MIDPDNPPFTVKASESAYRCEHPEIIVGRFGEMLVKIFVGAVLVLMALIVLTKMFFVGIKDRLVWGQL